ncbi:MULTISPECIES: efflux RND transporter permease subunit [Methylococcus]|uniref:Efflux RND transporter permease subunit n=1 Tax=Methylococcus capsulatus TaxID=414 RepID=A0ABZ2F7D4_METCP|nr:MULTISPECIES: efflux RND transporter permease subunit [Methylococcus]MDF9392632.1 efflux RND transporter permease subunit [Methylococcus capsulatus]
MLGPLVRFAVHRSGVVIALAVLLAAYGLYRAATAKLDVFPEFSAKRVVVQTEAPGFTTRQVEILLTLPIERKLAGIVGLETLRSESIQGLSVVTAVFGEETDIYRDRQLVSERLALLAGQLPEGAGTPVLLPLSSSSATVQTLGLTSEALRPMELRTVADWVVAPRLLAVPGVADVNVFGGEIQQLQVQVDPARLKRFGLDLNAVSLAVRQSFRTQGAGFVENENQRLALQVTGLPLSPESLGNVILHRSPGAVLKLRDVGTVAFGPRPPIGAAAVNGAAGIVMMVIGQHGANTLEVSREVERGLAELTPVLASQGVTLHPRLFRPADYIERALDNLTGHLLAGGLLVMAVLYAFLYNVRTAVISAVAIPLSLLGAFVVLEAFGVSLNIMVLGGLAIALGEVVDDAIIDTENIFRRLRDNCAAASPRPALAVVYEASMEVRGSVVYASFIVALVFVPLLGLGGVAGRLFAPLGYAYIVAILLSLATALTVTPALCVALLARSQELTETPPLIRWLQPRYGRWLRRTAKRPGQLAAGSLAVCVLAVMLAPGMGGDFLPRLREGHYIVHTASLPGTSLQESLRVGGLIVRTLLQIPGVASVSQWAGRAERGADTYGSHYSEYEVRLHPLSGSEQQAVLDRLRDRLGAFPGIRAEVNTFLTERVNETISGYTSPVAVNLYGEDLDLLDRKARELAAEIGKMIGAADVQLRSPPGSPLAEIRLRPDQLQLWGLRPADVMDAVDTAFAGRTVGHFPLGQRIVETSVILRPDFRQSLGSLRELPLKSQDGTLVTLGEVAEVSETGERYNILHRGGRRIQTVTAGVEGRDLASFLEELRTRLATVLGHSAGVYAEITGAAIEQGVARRELIARACLAGGGVLVLAYLAIGRLRHTAIALANLPFSLAGGVLAAGISGASLSVGALVGFVTLFGITVRNTIMLLSHYRHLVEREGQIWNLDTAVRGAQERLPSILMTALVTALAMLPIALGSDNPGREIMGPMAAIIIGGLFSSTCLNLALLPAMLLRWGGSFENR